MSLGLKALFKNGMPEVAERELIRSRSRTSKRKLQPSMLQDYQTVPKWQDNGHDRSCFHLMLILSILHSVILQYIGVRVRSSFSKSVTAKVV